MRSKYTLGIPSVPAMPKWADDFGTFREQVVMYLNDLHEWLITLAAVLLDSAKDNAVDHDEIDDRLRSLGG